VELLVMVEFGGGVLEGVKLRNTRALDQVLMMTDTGEELVKS
jgi:hypothetical protein